MSENDSVLLTEELFNKLLAYRMQYEEYNLSEIHILKKLFNNLTINENIPPQRAVDILKNFYLFNTFQITQSEINDILDQSLHNSQNENQFNLPPALQLLFNRYPILNQRIRHAINHNHLNVPNELPPQPPTTPTSDSTVSQELPPLPTVPPPTRLPPSINRTRYTTLTQSPISTSTTPIRPRIVLNTYPNNQNRISNLLDSISLDYNIPNNVPYENLSEYPNIPGVRIFNNPIFGANNIFSNVINNDLMHHGIRNTSPANILFSNNPGFIMGTNYTSQIVDTVSNILRERLNTQNNMEDVPIVLKESVFNQLPKNKYKDLPEEFRKDFKSCPISMQDYEDDTELVKLPCNHYFSVEFAKTWLLDNSHKCPVCRASAGDNKPKI